ncbi:transposase [Kineococcus sp. SYSU DK006]|uniref:transposase n=1 Tax=Kineococcus sp. SYSU DK006 TaxID=3383127 RepID=UPI003D7D7958
MTQLLPLIGAFPSCVVCVVVLVCYRGTCSPTVTSVRLRLRLLPPRPAQTGIVPRIARRGAVHGSGLGRTRWVVERSFSWLHQSKRLRTRYGVRADLHLELLQLACALICHRKLPTS